MPKVLDKLYEKSSMKIHLFFNHFHPDALAGASLFTDLAIFLLVQGNDVRVTTTFPFYPAWKLRESDVGVSFRDETYAGLRIRRLSIYVPPKPTGLKRILSDLSFFRSMLARGNFPGWTPDVVLTTSPLFSQCLVQRFLYLGKNVPRVIVVQDFVIDAAIELKMLSFPGISQLLRMVERWAYNSARTLITISEPMLVKLRQKVHANRRVVLLPNWIHKSLRTEIDAQQPIPISRQPATLLYAGNVGVKQGLPDFIDVFSACDGTWKLQIHGGGADVERLLVHAANVPSVTIGGVLDEPEYVDALRTATACLVTQKAGVGANFLPSKLLPALATGTPVLAVCDSASPLGKEVLEGGFGEVVEPGDLSNLTAVLRRWHDDPRLLAEMSIRSKARAALYSRDRILSLYEQELQSLVDSNTRHGAC